MRKRQIKRNASSAAHTRTFCIGENVFLVPIFIPHSASALSSFFCYACRVPLSSLTHRPPSSHGALKYARISTDALDRGSAAPRCFGMQATHSTPAPLAPSRTHVSVHADTESALYVYVGAHPPSDGYTARHGDAPRNAVAAWRGARARERPISIMCAPCAPPSPPFIPRKAGHGEGWRVLRHLCRCLPNARLISETVGT